MTKVAANAMSCFLGVLCVVAHPARMHESCAIPVQTVLAITSAHICNAAAERERERERERGSERGIEIFRNLQFESEHALLLLSLPPFVLHLVVTNFLSISSSFSLHSSLPSESTPTPDFLLTHLPTLTLSPTAPFLPSAFVSAAKLSEFRTFAATSQSAEEGCCTSEALP